MKIITLTGASASGKDRLLKELIENNEKIKPVISVTTRPPREGEEDGVQYKFIKIEELQKLFDNEEIIEYREYETVEGYWYYAITKDSIDVNSDNVYVVILDVHGVTQLRQYLDRLESDIPVEIQSIFLNCNGQERLTRSLKRSELFTDSEVAEMCRRYLDDQYQVIIYRDAFDLILRNETEEDLRRCIKVIGGLIEDTNAES